MSLSFHAPTIIECDCVGSPTDSLIHEGKTGWWRGFFTAQTKSLTRRSAPVIEFLSRDRRGKTPDLPLKFIGFSSIRGSREWGALR